jgi:integrase
VPRWDLIAAMHQGVVGVQEVNAVLALPDGVAQLSERVHGHRLQREREEWSATPVEPLVHKWPALAPGKRTRPQEATLANRRSRVRRIAQRLPTLGQWTTEALQQVLSPDARTVQGGQPVGTAETQRTFLRDLRLFSRWLVAIGKLPEDPTSGVVLDAHTPPPIRAVSLEVLQRVHAQIPPGPLADAFGLLIATGAEPQVVERVTVGDVRLNEQRVWLLGTKNIYRRRWAYVEAWYLPTLRRLMQSKSQADRLFHVTRGQLAAAVREAAARARDEDPELSLPGSFRPYDARHSFAARYVERGAHLRVVADQLGHANEGMIIRLYGRYRADVGTLRAHDEGHIEYCLG